MGCNCFKGSRGIDVDEEGNKKRPLVTEHSVLGDSMDTGNRGLEKDIELTKDEETPGLRSK